MYLEHQMRGQWSEHGDGRMMAGSGSIYGACVLEPHTSPL